MEATNEIPNEDTVEFEDVQLSETEDSQNLIPSDSNPINIDYNNRIVSKENYSSSQLSDNCDMQFSDNQVYKPSLATDEEKLEETSSEEFELPEEDQPFFKAVCLQKIDLDGIACAAGNRHLESSSSFDYSSTTFKEDCLTDAENISEDEGDRMGNQYVNDDAYTGERKPNRLSFGLSVTDLASTIKDVFSSKQTTLSSVSITNPFSSTFGIKKDTELNFPDDTKPLMTCLEFLKSDPSEDELTDVEDLSAEYSENKSLATCDLEEAMRYRGKTASQKLNDRGGRKNSWTTELLSDDEASSSEANQLVERRKKHNKRRSSGEGEGQSLTDEEFVEIDGAEWTETDESGIVRQITQIKTETSIKLEGDGAVRSLRKTPKRESSDEEKKSTDSEQEDLSFTEKKSFFQRLSLTSDTLPTSNKWTQDVSLDDLPMAEGEIIQEQISFEDKFKMFEPDEGNRKKIQKRDKPEQPTVYLYNFTKTQKPAVELPASELEEAEEIVKKVNEELIVEEKRLSDSDPEEADPNSATTLDKVEQEVYSLINKVDKEEKELYNSYYEEKSENKCQSPDSQMQMSEQSENDVEPCILETEPKSLISEMYGEKSYTTSMIEAEENFATIQVQPLMESEGAERKFSIDLCKQEEYNEAIKLDVDDDNMEVVKRSKIRPSNLEELSSVVDSHIKSEILREEIDQSIEESPLEVKHIVEDLEVISASDDHKCKVYKHIRTEIFSQELGQDIESGSPERKELGAFSLKKSDSPSHEFDDKVTNLEPESKQEISEVCIENIETDSLVVGTEKVSKTLSPQISEESCGHTDEISSEGIAVEHDEHLVDYEEAMDEHSLTEQLQALASDTMNYSKPFTMSEPHQMSEFGLQEFDSSGMSSNFSDIDMHRRSKDIGFSRHDKEIRSLKSTKQVSTIEEHSSIESCDSPQELLLQDLPEKIDTKENSDVEFLKEDTYFIAVEEKEACQESSLISDSLPISSLLPSHSEEDSDKSSKLPRSDSKLSQGRKSDSDAEGSKLDSSGEASGKRKEESCSSSGETESPYYSVETSDSGKTPRSTPAASRPCSSEFDVNVFSGHGSEYETCVTSQEASGEASGSYATAVSSQEISYATACSSFSHSSRESAYSVDSESSGHLASVEVSSEASETLVPSAQEMELEFAPELEMPVLDEEPPSEDSVKEPYDMEIPESLIREGIEMPFMKDWDTNNSTDNEKMKQLPQQWMWQYAAESEIVDKFEVLDESNVTEEQKQTSASIADAQPGDCAYALKSENTVQHSQVGTFSHSGPSHRRSFSSVTDIIPDRELMEQQSSTVIDEEQFSVSESSATHSEQTWQTSSIDTAVQLSSHALVSSFSADGPNLVSDSFQETPPEKELMSEQSQSSQPGSSYLQLNGPIEVEYNPDYDNSEGGDAELTSNQNQSPMLYESEGLQFDMEMEGGSGGPQIVQESNALPSSFNVQDLDLNVENNSLISSNNQVPHSTSDYDSQNISSLDAEKPEAQQEQSFSFQNYSHRESESLVCPDFASYLPESDQCDLIPGGSDSLPPSLESEVNIPIAESLSSSEGISHTGTRSDLIADRQSMESLEKGEIVDTSPEDERYESIKPHCSNKSPTEEMDFSNGSPALKFNDNDVLNPESDYVSETFTSKYDEVPGTDLYTHHEEDEFDLRGSDVYPSPIPSVEDDKQSTPSSDVLHGRRFFPRSGETSAASSLQEFERLEAEIAAGRISRSSIDSSERVAITKSGEHDDVSMNSLTEFEKIERDCVENEAENKAAVEDILLSEIEEGLESQCSEALEILQESVHDASDLEYEQRRLEMEELIKVTQLNVEKFQEETASEGITSDECTVVVRVTSEMQDTSEATKTSSKEDGNTDMDDSENLPLTQDIDNTVGGHDSSSSGDKNYGNGKLDCMVSSTDSMDPSSSTATHATYQFETDSVMSSSLNSAQASGEECTMVSSTDTLEPEPNVTYSTCDISDTMHLTKSGDGASYSSKGALACKLEELQATNGAKQQMEMFLSKLTDDTVLMDDFTSPSLPDYIEDSEQHTAPDDFIQSNEAAQGISSSGDGSAIDSDDLISRTTTTTRIVTTVSSDQDGEDQQEAGGEDLRHSVEVILNQFMNDGDSSKQEDSHSGTEE